MPQIDGHTQLLGVFGHPIGHSLSPIMHNALLQDRGIHAVYLPLHAHPDHLADAVAGFRALGFVGANVTIPFKEPMAHLVDDLTPIARFMGSVNTLFWDNGKLVGTTTDSFGALKNLEEHGVSLQGRHITLLGNGGASRALAFAMLDGSSGYPYGKPASVLLVGRDLAKVDLLAQDLRAAGLGQEPVLQTTTFSSFGEYAARTDLLVNCTPVGMTPRSEETPLDARFLHADMTVYDIVYNPMETRLLREAKAAGCPVVGGLGMLVHQGTLSFDHWFPGKADASIMRAALLAHLGVQP